MHAAHMKLGAIIAALGTAPLLLYIAFGPADGNPIGLGLLAWASWLLAAVVVAVGMARRMFRRWRDR